MQILAQMEHLHPMVESEAQAQDADHVDAAEYRAGLECHGLGHRLAQLCLFRILLCIRDIMDYVFGFPATKHHSKEGIMTGVVT